MFRKGLLNFLYYFIFLSIALFFSPFLMEKGIDEITMGYLTSFGLLVMFILYYVFGYLSDLFRSNKIILIINLFITILIFLALAFSNNNIILALAYVFSYGFFMVLAPVLDGFTIQGIDSKYYNILRGFGSLGAAVSYSLNTFFLNGNYTTLIILNVSLLFIMIIVLFTLNNYYAKVQKVKIIDGIKYSITHKTILIILLLSFLTYGTLKADDAYSYMYNSEYVLLSAFLIGLFGSLSTFFEAFVMMISTKFNNIKRSNLLLIATITLFIIYFCRFTLYHNRIIILITNVFIGLFIGLFVPLVIKYLKNISKKNLRNTILSMYQMSITLGGIIIGFITTTFLALYNSLPNIYLLHSIVIFIAIIIIIMYRKDIDTK